MRLTPCDRWQQWLAEKALTPCERWQQWLAEKAVDRMGPRTAAPAERVLGLFRTRVLVGSVVLPT
eukprot:9748110-Alexandrium_andersonii.AAC.1